MQNKLKNQDANTTKGRIKVANQSQWLKGLLELAVLSALQEAPLYGLNLLERLQREAGLPLAEGSIYPLLHRLERNGVIASQWQLDDSATRPRKYYALTDAGRAELAEALDDWQRTSATLNRFLQRSRS